MAVFSSPSLSFPTTSVEILCEKKSQRGISWYTGDSFLWNSKSKSSFLKLKRRVCRTTIVENQEGLFLATPEHLTPVLLLWPEISFQIKVSNQEIPLFDGSALPWFQKIKPLAGNPQELCFYKAPISEKLAWKNGFFEISPAKNFEIEYSVSNRFMEDSLYISIETTADLLPIFQARTFIFEEDFLKAKQSGLLAGTDESSGLLLKANSLNNISVLHGSPLRHPQEPLLHKILDLIGDITLPAPFLPRLKIQIHNGGHTTHHQLLERLLSYVPFEFSV